ncbi:hypothetical protein FRC07_005308 [Ceratobasidium sp. 392]|nr:hypothetical protein FRC07_005308 [Ceratobasidium sp. 392]
MSSPQVKLVSNDNQEFEVSWEVFRMFGMFAPQDDPRDCPSGPFPLSQITSPILQKVIEYCEHHKHDPRLPDDSDIYEHPPPMSEWDKTYITEVDQAMLFNILLAANYLSIKPLLNFGTRQVAESIKGKNPSQIQEMFMIASDFTPAEETNGEGRQRSGEKM